MPVCDVCVIAWGTFVLGSSFLPVAAAVVDVMLLLSFVDRTWVVGVSG